MEGIQTTYLLRSFWKALCMKDETLVYCLMTIIISVPLKTSFCSVSILFKLKELYSPALFWSGAQKQGMKWTKLTTSGGNLWRAGSLLSFLLLASGQQHMWITYFFVWFNRSAVQSEGTQEILLVFNWNIHYIWEVALPGCNLFMISKKPVYLVSF